MSNSGGRYRIGVDVGGTFTDVIAVDGEGRVTFVKAASTPQDQSIGVMKALSLLAERLGLEMGELLSRTERIMHGMTVATNALLERKGARVGLLTTEGHRDVLEMREGLKPERYDLRLPRPEPLVPRYLRLGVRERVRADGGIEVPLDEVSLARAVRALAKAKVRSVAVCYLHAWRDDVHERRTREVLADALPGVYVSLSSQVLPQIKEYQRVSTTVVNAYVGPLIRGYLEGLERGLGEAGYRGPLLVMLSHGGVAPVEEAVRIAAATVLSGPAGGVAGARRVATMQEAPNLIPFDMGGTSTDISLIADGEATLSAERPIANERIALPSLDIITLGAGGGSIARVEEGGLLKVGPRSAGAVPGPACYGQGGEAATVTDASVALGYLDPDNFLGGGARLDRGAAERVMARLGAALGIDPLRAAEGVHRVVNTQMAEGIRLATVRRGVDPRRFGLLGFGGAAGLHATALARTLGLPAGAAAADRIGPVGVGHARDRASLRGGALPRGRDRPPRRGHRAPALPGARGSGPGTHGRVVRRRDRFAAVGRDALRRADIRDRRALRGERSRRAGPARPPETRLRAPARAALHLQPGRPGAGARQRPGGDGGTDAGASRRAFRRRPAGRGSARHAPDLSRRVAPGARVRLRRARGGTGPRGAGHRGVRYHHRAAARRRPGHRERAALAGHRGRRLSEGPVPSACDPMALLTADRERAQAAGDPMADLCVLATVGEEGAPALRTLVVRGIDSRSILIFINRSSPKWSELHRSGRFEVLCYYSTLGLQYRARGRTTPHDVDAVRLSWKRKPYRTRLLDWYYERERPQSAPLESREELVAGHRRMRAQFPDPESVPAPDGVRGLDLVVDGIERLDLNATPVHERRAFARAGESWREVALVP